MLGGMLINVSPFVELLKLASALLGLLSLEVVSAQSWTVQPPASACAELLHVIADDLVRETATDYKFKPCWCASAIHISVGHVRNRMRGHAVHVSCP